MTNGGTARAERWRERTTSGQARRSQRPSPYVVRDAEAFARNLARAVEQGGRALAAYLKPHEEGKPADLIAEATTEIVKTLGRIGEYWTSDPARLMEAQTRLFASYFTIWQSAIGARPGQRRQRPRRIPATAASATPTGTRTRCSRR